ncbi:hypothetical protein DFS34DRAFT_661141 [Phlyctochytrium arcticum]|nr:hypothetical protein DFS34DRAFT_661141 [Phlyctochytrium arcticum]
MATFHYYPTANYRKKSSGKARGNRLKRDNSFMLFLAHYIGWIYNSDGTDRERFDSSYERGFPLEFALGEGTVVEGWKIAAATMKRDECASIICAAEYAYGDEGYQGVIPGGATLRFEITIVDAESVPLFIRYSQTLTQKDQANALYTKQDYTAATDAYMRAVDLLKQAFWSVPEADAAFNQDDVARLSMTLYSNPAAAQLKLGHAEEAVTACRKGLELADEVASGDVGPGEAKLVFRLGLALMEVGKFDESEESLKRPDVMVPEDQAIKLALRQVGKRRQTARKGELDMYRAMVGNKDEHQQDIMRQL